jgi:hypothetical protein
LFGCPKPTDSQAVKPGGPRVAKGVAGDDKPAPSPAKTGMPMARIDRPYKDVHQDVKRAWFMVESAYLVVGDKYKAAYQGEPAADPNAANKRGSQQKAVNEEIQRNLFGVQPAIMQLFEGAIKAEPDNPLNMVAYAVYLKPRRDYSKPKYAEQEPEALKLMDRAIELWPDEACFYVAKAVMMVSPQRVHEYSRTTPMEEELLAARDAEVRDLLTKAELYDKKNSYINYYKAQLIARFATERAGPEGAVEAARAEMLREVKAGNEKKYADFIFPPPLDPYWAGSRELKLLPGSAEAIYYDNWAQFGWYDVNGQQALMMTILDGAQWPRDKEDIGALMWMFYHMGRTAPFERTYFSWQQLVLTAMRDDPATPPEEKAKLSQVLFNLNDLYVQACQRLVGLGIYIDPTQYDARGFQDAELKSARNGRVKDLIQPLHGSFLDTAGHTLGLDFPLDPDPKTWGN